MAKYLYDSVKKKYYGKDTEDDFYCGKNLNELAISLKLLKDGEFSLQEAYDYIVNNIIIKHVIENSQCECRQYLHKLKEELSDAKRKRI